MALCSVFYTSYKVARGFEAQAKLREVFLQSKLSQRLNPNIHFLGSQTCSENTQLSRIACEA